MLRTAAFLLAVPLAGCGGGSGGDGFGELFVTYYWVVSTSDFEGPADTELVDLSCAPIATVPEAFAASACVEGTGKLGDGRVVNYADSCDCGFPCSSGPTVCFMTLDPAVFPWGAGASDNPLTPLRSWAVDPDVIPLGTRVYAPGWDGVAIPSVDGLGGFTHDGCFSADDIGNGIDGRHFDFFAGTRDMATALEGIFDSVESRFEVLPGDEQCP